MFSASRADLSSKVDVFDVGTRDSVLRDFDAAPLHIHVAQVLAREPSLLFRTPLAAPVGHPLTCLSTTSVLACMPVCCLLWVGGEAAPSL